MKNTNLITRNEGYTTDGFFLILTEAENKRLQKKESDDLRPACKVLVDRTLDNDLVELALYPVTCKGDGLTVRRFTGNTQKTYIQQKFLSYFGSLKGLTFYQENQEKSKYSYSYLTPIVVKRNNEFLGLIMPMRYEFN